MRLKRSLALALSVLMLLTLVPFAVFADETVGGETDSGKVVIVTNAEQLKNLEAGNTYVLDADIKTEDISGNINVTGGSVKIDLGDHTLTLGAATKINVTDGTLTLVSGNGKIDASYNGTVAIAVSGTLVMEGDVEIVEDTKGNKDISLDKNGKISVKTELSGKYSVSVNGKLVGDTFVACGDNAVALANKDKFDFYNGTELVAVSVKNGVISYASGEIECTQVSLVLDGSINVKFYFVYPDDVTPEKIHYTVGSDVQGELEVGEYTAFIIAVTPDKYKDTVTVWFDDDADTKFEYSVSQYIEDASEQEKDSKLDALTKALKVYCDSVIAYNNSEATVAEPENWSEALKESLDSYKNMTIVKPSETDPHVVIEGMSVVLASNTTVRMHVRMFNNIGTNANDTKYQARIFKNEAKYEIWYNVDFDDSKLDGVNYIDIEIPVAEYGDAFKVSIGYVGSNGEWVSETSIEVSLNYYFYTVLNAEDGKYEADHINLIKAMYLYNLAAVNYFKANV